MAAGIGHGSPRTPGRWQSAAAAAWPVVRQAVLTPSEQRAARRRAREQEQVRRAHERAVRAHAAAVARREQVLRASRRALPAWGAVAGGAAVAVPLTGVSGTVLTVVGGAALARVAVAVRRLARPPHVPPAPPALPAPTAPAPDPRSAAAPAVRRLDRVRVDLQRLLPMVGPAGRAAAEEAWTAAADADGVLRWHAARLSAAEPYRGADPLLLTELLDGVTAQERLVSAVADLVVASADTGDRERLQDVTDRLHGLASALRELR